MGKYLDITSVTGPSQATAGASVRLNVSITNKWSAALQAYLALSYDGQEVHTNPAVLEPTAYSWPLVFTMPGKTVNGLVYARYLATDGNWYNDDSFAANVALAGEAPPTGYAGRIENIRVNSIGAPATLAYGAGFRVQFDGYNDSSVNVKLWASIRIKRPDGSQAYYGEDAESFPYTDPGGKHPFEFPKRVPYESACSADAYGNWTADIELRVNGPTGNFLARKTGYRIFSTGSAPPGGEEPSYSGEITKVQGRRGVDNWGSLPLSLEQDEGYSLAVTVVNRSEIALVLRGELTITKPSGAKDYASDFTGTSIPPTETAVSPGGSHTFKWNPYGQVQAFTADEAGDYEAKFVLMGKKPGEAASAYRELCTAWEGVVAAVGGGGNGGGGESPPGYEGKIDKVMVDWTNLAGGEQPIPVQGAPVGEHCRVSFEGWNLSSSIRRLCGEVWVIGPDGTSVKYNASDCSTVGYTPNTAHKFVFPTAPMAFAIDEAGEWGIKIELRATDNTVMATYEGPLFTAEVQTDTWSLISELMPMMMLLMMFGMMVPMMKETSAGLEEGNE